MASVPQKHHRVKPPGKFALNCALARKAGYNLRFTDANVYVDGKPVDRECFDLHPIQLLSLLDSRIGRKGMWLPPETAEV